MNNLQTIDTNPITAFPTGAVFTELSNKAARWDFVTDVVDYPVNFIPLYIKPSKVEHYEDFDEETYIPAAGVTNTGRNVEFYGVVVDKLRNGTLNTISTVTGLYATLPTKDVYLDLKNDLEALGVAAMPTYIYVSGDGGNQLLRVRLDGLESPLLDGKEFHLNLDLLTSVDGSKKHQVTLTPTTNGVALMGIGESVFNVATKHTKGIKDQHIVFSVIINKMIEEWNEVIAPTLRMLDGEVIDKYTAMQLTESLLEASEVPDRHIQAALEGVRVLEGRQTILGVLGEVSEYFHKTLEDKPERLAHFKTKINKSAKKVIDKVLRH